MTEIAFVVRGRPVPQGGLTRSPSGGLYHSGGPRLRRWRAAISLAATEARGFEPVITGPVIVVGRFVLARPANHYLPVNGRRAVRELRLDAPKYPAGTPDVDKLARALLDALTGVVIKDDAQVASLMAVKLYETDELAEGVRVRVSSLEETR
jgi:crossover junction endodeoxyribonuclease RusA